MADYTPGKMDITTQRKTFAGFIRVGIWLSVIVAITLIFLAIVGT